MQTLGLGTWSKVGKGYCLQGATDSQNPNSTVAAGLPQISGGFWNILTSGTQATTTMATVDGAFYANYRDTDDVHTVIPNFRTKWGDNDGVGFQASRSSSIYGKSTTVQPPAYLVHIWRRTA